MLTGIKLFVLLSFCCGYLLADEEVVVEIPDGKLKGRVVVSPTNTTFYSFQGIPYAEPPVNELRFKAPQPVRPWDDVRDATKEGYTCYQVPNDRDDENEDCLVINVYTPKIWKVYKNIIKDECGPLNAELLRSAISCEPFHLAECCNDSPTNL